LLDMRVAVKADDGRVRDVREGFADARGPRTIDEPEIRKGVGAQPFNEFGRRGGERLGKWSKRALRRGLLRMKNTTERREHDAKREPTTATTATHAASCAPEILAELRNALSRLA
jgi:hypothetical protein